MVKLTPYGSYIHLIYYYQQHFSKYKLKIIINNLKDRNTSYVIIV